MVTFWADAELLRAIDAARRGPPRADRSEFIRTAIVDKLRKLGYPVDAALAQAPDRVSKVIHIPERRTLGAVRVAALARVAEKPGRYGAKRRKKR